MTLSSKTQKLTLYVLTGLLLLNLPIYFFLVRKEVEAANGEAARREQMGIQLSRQTATVQALREMSKKFTESRHRYGEFVDDYLFPKKKMASELLMELDQISAEAGLTRNRVGYHFDPEPAFGLQRMVITLPVEGSYANIRNFLNLLESHEKFIIIDSMALVSEREGTGMIRLDVTLSTLLPV
ncbi:MAG: type 4a pilus biogenesis protein PilO [Terriglobia bacterium]